MLLLRNQLNFVGHRISAYSVLFLSRPIYAFPSDPGPRLLNSYLLLFLYPIASTFSSEPPTDAEFLSFHKMNRHLVL